MKRFTPKYALYTVALSVAFLSVFFWLINGSQSIKKTSNSLDGSAENQSEIPVEQEDNQIALWEEYKSIIDKNPLASKSDSIYSHDVNGEAFTIMKNGEVFIDDIRTIKNYKEIDIASLPGLRLWGESNDKRYLGFMELIFEGTFSGQVYYLDAQNLQDGFRAVDKVHVTSIDQIVSPDYSKVLYSDLVEVEIQGGKIYRAPGGKVVKYFDLNTLDSKKVYETDGERTTMKASGMGDDYLDAYWTSNEGVHIFDRARAMLEGDLDLKSVKVNIND